MRAALYALFLFGPGTGFLPACQLATALRETLHDAVSPGTRVAWVLPVDQDVGVWLSPGAVVSLNLSVTQQEQCATIFVVSGSQYDLWWNQDVIGDAPTQWRHTLCGTLSVDVRINAPHADTYFVGLSNMQRGVLTVEGTISYVNPDDHHLPLDFRFVPAVLWWSSASFFLLSLVATYVFSVLCAGRFSRLHFVVVVCISMKSFALSAEWKCVHAEDTLGYAPPWDVHLYQLCANVHSIIDMVLFLLVAMGWRTFQSELSPLESRFVATILATSLFISLWAAVGGPDLDANYSQLLALNFIAGPNPDANYSQLLALNLMLCYLATTLTLRTNMARMNRQLGAFQLESPHESHVVERLYERQRKFVIFRRLFCARVLETFFPWGLLEVCVGKVGVLVPTVSTQLTLAVIYIVLAWTVAPASRNSRVAVLLQTILADSDESSGEESSNSLILNDVDYWPLVAGDSD